MNQRQRIIQHLLEQCNSSQRELLQLRCDQVVGMGRKLRLQFETRQCIIGDMDARREILEWNRKRIADGGYGASFLGVKKRQLMNDVKVATGGAGIRGYPLC
jgi:hypothetical protein